MAAQAGATASAGVAADGFASDTGAESVAARCASILGGVGVLCGHLALEMRGEK